MGAVPWLMRLAGRFAVGYLFHYAFVMLIGVSLIITWFAAGGGAAMSNLLTLVTFLPALGALVLMLVLRGDDAAREAERQAWWRC
jgi:hypothetical protein